MAKVLENKLSTINWDDVLLNLGQGDKRDVAKIWENKDSLPDTPSYNAYKELFERWKKAGYRISNIYWYNYYAGKHYSNDIDKEFAKFTGSTLLRSWISRVDPGSNVPYHWDVDDRVDEWKELGKLIRLSCFIDKPKWGSAFIIEDELFYNLEQGSIIEWNSWDSYHAATVAGKEPQYLYHFLGYV